MIRHFQPEKIPPAFSWFEREIGQLTKADRKGWRRGRCPWHKSQSGKSFAVHEDGAWYCFGGCGKGSSIVSFVMRRDRLSFKQAAQSLGARDQASRCGIGLT